MTKSTCTCIDIAHDHPPNSCPRYSAAFRGAVCHECAGWRFPVPVVELLPKQEPVFAGFPKISRLNRDIIITEKIDGTNAAIGVTEDGEVYAQSRTRIITPEQDNFGFAAWVQKNAEALRETLGLGLHFGEWWGLGIQRGYGLTERRFSLFNTAKWGDDALGACGIGALYYVPVLYEGPMSTETIENALDYLRSFGSLAVPGFMKPEGIVIHHTAAKTMFKVTLEGDEKPKGSKE